MYLVSLKLWVHNPLLLEVFPLVVVVAVSLFNGAESYPRVFVLTTV